MSEADLELLGGLTITNGLTVSGGTVDFSGAASGGGIELTALSATTAAAGTTGLAYDNTTGVFTYTPPDLSTYATTSSLSSYATTSSLSSYATTASLAAVATSGAYSDISGTPSLATVATSGAYSDLTGTPTALTNTDGLTEGSTNLYFTNARATSAITGSDLDMGGNKVLFGNMYSAEGNLPSATTYHGMFAHVHGTGKGYFAHAGNWVKLLDETSSTTTDLTEGTNLYYTDARARASLSASTAAAGTAGLAYDSSTGQFTLTPPDLSSYLTSASLSGYATTASLATVATSGAYADISGTPTLATVATSGAYSDLTGAPTLATVATTGAYSDLTGAPAALTNTDGLTEGSTNLYHTTARARSSISANNGAVGSADGSISYNQVNGEITYTKPDFSSYLTDITGEALSSLSNVASTTPTDGQVLTYDTTNGWQPETPASGGGSTINWIASNVTSSATATGNGALALGGSSTTGSEALAVGNYAVASGSESVAIGSSNSNTTHLKTNATSAYAIALGHRAQAVGLNAITIGWQAEAGTSTKAYSVAIGSQAMSQYEKSVALGYTATTTADRQLMLGATGTNGFTSIRVGNTGYTPSDNLDLATKAYVDSASGGGGGGTDYLAAEGTDTTAATATGTSAVAAGYDADAGGAYSVSLGYQANAAMTSSIAIGYLANASVGNQTVAIGQAADAQGTYGIALGLNSEANQNYSAAIGYFATASQANQLMLGRNSNTNGFTSIRVGNTSYYPSDNMDLATKAYVDNNAGLPATIATGSGAGSALAGGSNSVALGQSSNASANNTVAIGRIARASSAGSIAIGDSAYARGSNSNGSIAIGIAADANGTTNPIAIGAWSDAGNYSTAVGCGYSSNVRCYAAYTSSAFGYKAVAGGNYQVAVGGFSYANNNNAHAVGYSTTANGVNANAFGYQATAYQNEFVLGNSSINNLKCQDTSITGVSDSRDKTNITALTLGLDFVNNIEPKAFNKNNRSEYYTAAYDEPTLETTEGIEQSYTFDQTAYEAGTQKTSKREFGFIAQDVAAQLPAEYSDARLTYSETEDNYGFDVQRFTIGDMTPILWKALRELSNKHDQLQTDYDALLARVVALENA